MERIILGSYFDRVWIEASKIAALPLVGPNPICDAVHNIGNWVNTDLVTNDIL
jgi:hypothetical protein